MPVERCPTCGAAYRGGVECRRCGTDFSRILAVEGRAAEHRGKAMAALRAGQVERARTWAQEACRLHRCRESLQVAALAALMAGDFPGALSRWETAVEAAEQSAQH